MDRFLQLYNIIISDYLGWGTFKKDSEEGWIFFFGNIRIPVSSGAKVIFLIFMCTFRGLWANPTGYMTITAVCATVCTIQYLQIYEEDFQEKLREAAKTYTPPATRNTDFEKECQSRGIKLGANTVEPEPQPIEQSHEENRDNTANEFNMIPGKKNGKSSKKKIADNRPVEEEERRNTAA